MTIQKLLVLDSGSGGTNLPKEYVPVDTSTGASDAGKPVALNASGVLDSTLFPPGIGESSQSFPTSESITASALVNLYLVSTTWTARNANATDATKPAMGFVLASTTSPANTTVYFPGQIVTGASGLTPGPVFLDTTSGAVSSTAPSTAGNLVQQVGYALSATSFVFQPAPGIIKG